MKAIVATFIVRDEAEEHALTNALMEDVAQHWPTLTVEVRETKTYEDTWFKEEYCDPMGWNEDDEDEDPAVASDVTVYGAGSQ